MTPVGRQDPPRIPEARGLGTEDYLSILGLRDDFDAWACVELPGLVLRVPRGDRWPAPDGHLVLAARVASFGARSVPGEDGPPTHGRVTRETWDLSETFAVFALARIVDEYETRVAAVRDRLGSVVLRSARRAVSQMQRVERDLAELARDARPLLRAVISAPEYVWKGQAATFLPVSEHDRDDPPFFTTVAQRLVWRAGRLLAAESEARETAQTMSSLVAASANLRVARTNLLLQVISVAFAVLAVLLAAVALPDGLKAIPRLWRGNTSPPAAGAPPARADGARPGAVR